VWVWCGNADGCGGRKHQECWLKKQQDMRLTHIAGGRGAAGLMQRIKLLVLFTRVHCSWHL
jgi:hypothetical protein